MLEMDVARKIEQHGATRAENTIQLISFEARPLWTGAKAAARMRQSATETQALEWAILTARVVAANGGLL